MEQEALSWMRKQAKEIAPGVIGENELPALCARVISSRIDELQEFVKDIIKSGSSNVFLLEQARKLVS